jgi:hypothetical protein
LVTHTPDGGIDLRVAQRRRRWLVAGTIAVAFAWSVRILQGVAGGRPFPLGTSPLVAAGIALLLSGFAVWCAYGTESWHVAPNRLEHRVGIGRWGRVRRYHDATLEIAGHTDQYGRPYYRLYVVADDGRHFLVERRLAELNALADLMAVQTGWQRRDAG